MPRDDATLFMFSAAYQFSYVLPRLVDATAPDVGSAFITRGPMNVYLGPQVVLNKANRLSCADPVQDERLLQSSAAGSSACSARRPKSAYPLGVEPRVIAHELGPRRLPDLVFAGGEEADCDAAQAAGEHRPIPCSRVGLDRGS